MNQWPGPLEEILNQKDTGIRFSVIDRGIDGANTMIIISGLEDNLDKYNPDMVITMMGINDGSDAIPYDDIPNKKVLLFFKSFRVYKLARLLHLHIVNKAKEIRIYKVREQKEDLAKMIDSRQPNNFKEQEEMFKNAIELNPENEEGYIELGWYYRDAGEFTKAEEMFKKGIEINPENERGYIQLGVHYKETGEFTKAGEMFKKGIEINPENEDGYLELGGYYIDKGEYSKVEEIFKKAIEINPENYRLNAALAVFYMEKGKYSLAEGYSKKAESLGIEYYDPMTHYNYQRLKEIVAKRGKRLVCVQYPMRSVEPLKEMFRNREGIIFVDNERPFKERVAKEGYDEYFIDMFGGDFGHCTEKGNKLLAENIANTILRRIYSIKE